MKKILGFSTVLILAALLVFGLTIGPSLAQGEIDPQVGQNLEGSPANAPSSAELPAGTTIQWQSSADPPAGLIPLSSPDTSATQAELEAILVNYDAYYREIGSSLRPRRNDVDYTTNSSGGCLYASAGNPSTVFNVPIHLPHGAIVKYVRMYFYDANESLNSSSWFSLYDLFGNLVREFSVTTSGGGGNGYATTAEITETIDYNAYSYLLNWRPGDLGSDMQLCGFRIYYDAPNSPVFLPFINMDSE